MALPRKPNQHSRSRQAELRILRVLDFNPETLKCGSVALSNDAPPGAALFFVKGPPLVIKELVQPSTVPQDFDQVIHLSARFNCLPDVSVKKASMQLFSMSSELAPRRLGNLNLKRTGFVKEG